MNLYKNIKFLSNFVLHILKIPRELFSSFWLCNLQKLGQLFPPQCTILRLVECTTLCILCLLKENIYGIYKKEYFVVHIAIFLPALNDIIIY